MKNRFTSVLGMLFSTVVLLAFSLSNANAQTTYCTPSNTSSYQYYGINTITVQNSLANFSNANTGSSTTGYSDYSATPNDTAREMQGNSFTIAGSSVGGSVHWGIWVDWNQDGDFDDPGELVYVNNNYTSNFSVDVFVPYASTPGTTRFRIMADGSQQISSACSAAWGYSETEDYSLLIDAAPACSGQPDAGVITGASVINLCSGTGFTLTDTGATGAADMTYQWQERNPSGTGTWTDIAGAINFTYDVPNGITTSTDYRFYVVCNNSNLSDTSNAVTISMNAPNDCYCMPTLVGSSPYYMTYINTVQTTGGTININNQNNGISSSGYQDFRNTDTLEIMPGDQITLKPQISDLSGSQPYVGCMAWVDWNHDGDFDDPGENIVNILSQPMGNSFSSSFAVPITAQPGHTTLRVMAYPYQSNFGPCGISFPYDHGEAEDYTVIIDSLPSCSNTNFPTSATALISNDTLCVSGDVDLNLDTVFFLSGVDYIWQESSNGSSGWTNMDTSITPALSVTNITANTWYRCQVMCNGNQALLSSVVPVVVSNPSMASAPTSGTRCGPGTVTLSANPSTGSTVNWYDQPSGGSPLLIGSNDYTTYYIPNTTVFYAASMGGTVKHNGWVGDGTDEFSGAYYGDPLDNTSSSLKLQTLIPASRMHDFGFTKAGYITAMGFQVMAAGTADTLHDFTISMATTDQTSLPTGSWQSGNFQQVYFNANYAPQAGALNTYEFSTPFFWDGESSIVIEYCMHVNSANDALYPGWTIMGDYGTYNYPDMYESYYADYTSTTASACAATAPNSNGYYLPNLYFKIREFCEGPREPDTAYVTPGPPFELSYDTVICNGTVRPIAVSSPLSNYSQGYTWTALDPAGELYTDAAGTVPYTAGTNTSTVYFKSSVAGLHRIAVHASNGPGQNDCAAADTADIWVQPGSIFIAAMPDTICSSTANPVTIMSLMPNSGYASGPYIQWKESADGVNYNVIPAANNISYTTVPLYTAHYYQAIISADAGVCETPDKMIVVANPTVLSTSDSFNCGPGTVTLRATTGGSSHPVWYDSDTAASPIGNGSPWTTPFLLQTDTFYVAASGGANSVPADVIVGDGGSTTNYSGISPFYHLYGGYKHQFLIKKDELNAAGIYAGFITSLSFNVTTGGTVYDDFAISLGTTANASLSTTFEPVQEVRAPQNITTVSDSWNKYVFDQPFYWDGVSNLVVQTCWSTYNYGGSNSEVKYDNTTYTATHNRYADNTSAADICNGLGIYDATYVGRPQMAFGSFGPCETPRVPVIANIYPKPDVDLGSDINECVDSGTAMVLDAGVQQYNPQFLWENNSTSQIRSINQSGTYSVVVTNSYTCQDADTINVIMRHNPKVDLGGDTSVCENTSVTLDAGSEGIQYFWNTGANTQTITVNTPGSYNVLVTNAEGCTDGDTVTVDMSGQMPHYDGIMITNNGVLTFTFNALNPQGVVGYEWDFGDYSPHQFGPVVSHTYQNDGTYVVTLKATSNCGSYADSTSAHILGIGDLNLDNNQLSVYPNPTKDKATIVTKGVKMEKIAVYNVLGQKVYEAKADSPYEHELDLSGVASGVYNIRVYTESGVATRKLNVLR